MDGDDVIGLYDRHARELVAFFARRTGNRQVALDLLGATFLAAFEQREGARADSPRRQAAWLYRIAANKLIDHHRRGASELRALRLLAAEHLRLQDDEFELLEREPQSQPLAAMLAEAFAALSDEQQEAIRLYVIEEREYADLSREIGITEPAARARVSRGLRALRRATAQSAEELS
jgi:RNA polymerase sigma-70 factor (ECF subfamily)